MISSLNRVNFSTPVSVTRKLFSIPTAPTPGITNLGSKANTTQAQAIVDMRLRALTGLEREKLENEYKELMARIEQLKAILAEDVYKRQFIHKPMWKACG